MTDKTRNCIFQQRLHVNGQPHMVMRIHVERGRAYFGIKGMVEPFVVIERYPIELFVALGPSNSTLVEAIRIVEEPQ